MLTLQWYITAIREQTMRDVFSRPHSERRTIQEKAENTDGYWGYFWAYLEYPSSPDFDGITLARAAQIEFAAIEAILARAFAPM